MNSIPQRECHNSIQQLALTIIFTYHMMFDEMSKWNNCRLFHLQNGRNLSPATPPGGPPMLWAGWSLDAACWLYITRSYRGLSSHSCVSSRTFWMPLWPRRGCFVPRATRMAISSARGPSGPPLTHSPLTWDSWLTPSFVLLIKHCRAGTLADFHRNTSPDDDLQRS